MSKGLQTACLSRSQDVDIYVSSECARPDHPCPGRYADLAFTLEAAVPHSYRWATFSVNLCSEGQKRHIDYSSTKRLLHPRSSFPRLRKLAIQYSTEEGYSDTYQFPDVGGYGGFYLNWKTPLLTDLAASNYIPHPFIASTITNLTMALNRRINDAYLIAALAKATSLKELHFIFPDDVFIEERLDHSQLDEYITPLPQIEVLSITLFIGSQVRAVAFFIGEVFRFPNISSFSLVVLSNR